MARGNNKKPIFRDGADHEALLTGIAGIGAHHSWRTLSYCLMPNHFHLLIEASVPDLSAGMRDLLGTYARRFNRRHGRSGHVFGGRFRAVPVLDDRQVAAVVRYIALNPVVAGLCSDPAIWPWGSFGASMGAQPIHPSLSLDRLWELLGGTEPGGRALLGALVTPVPGT